MISNGDPHHTSLVLLLMARKAVKCLNEIKCGKNIKAIATTNKSKQIIERGREQWRSRKYAFNKLRYKLAEVKKMIAGTLNLVSIFLFPLFVHYFLVLLHLLFPRSSFHYFSYGCIMFPVALLLCFELLSEA